ncbi:hypothetical protein XENTR_v10023003 [Xenopus tropicalis]|uniref:Linker for activation of T-cells family member 1 n=1 Tax=Xenopus tropicalis TaxID=8364 RepID=A0A1B8Y136_XENTR|nr:linker for activation of T-cells family member 1 [Xenopus tropicalis]KAE8577649.1 hypothetical protein XENTR_v10023003 [Xenopus tropicalis]
MDSVNVTAGMWAVVLFLPVVITTALCLGCRKRPLTRIPQNVANYESKNYFTHPSTSSFMVLGPNYMQRTLPSPTVVSPPCHSLIVSPVLAESRRSSMGRVTQDSESAPDYENNPSPSCNCDDDENHSLGYIQVLPDDNVPNAEQPVTMPYPQDDQESISSAPDEQYVNEGNPRDSQGDSVEYVNLVDETCKHCGASGQNAKEENARDSQGESLEYVNLMEEEEEAQQSDNEEEMPDYENIDNSCKG